MKMRRALLTAPRQFVVEECDAPEMGPDQVLIAIRTCGVCPSDVRLYAGTRAGTTYPRTTGHEWVGDIVAVGESVTEYQVGDRVAAFVQRVCGMCRNCQRGLYNMCLNRLPAIQGGFQTMGLAVPQAIERIPEGLGYETACFAEPLACCYNGVMRTPIRVGDTVIVMGAGPIGQMLAQLAHLRGARVIAVDLLEERLELARELGAWKTLNAGDPDLVEQVHALTGGLGAEAVIVAVGSTRAEMQALELAAPGACVNYFAGTYPASTISVDPNVIHYKQLWVTGSFHFTPGGFRTALDLLARGEVQVLPLISHRFGLDQVAQAFDTVIERGGMKVIVNMDAQ
ncbi:MAG: zinc-dependent alcohol dehydrogenase [Anaerolineae bacterium]|jgi:L-iditol 2-dehydrogenase|nr:zinc-binding dehydrogenase [Chloroflexota bacterium]